MAVTANGDRYRAILNEFLFTKIEEQNIDNIWFQQDLAMCHTAEVTLDIFRLVSEDRIISRRADVVQPPRGCDLTALIYYLWGALKDKCYPDKPEAIDAREVIVEIQLHTTELHSELRFDTVGLLFVSAVEDVTPISQRQLTL